MVLWGAMLRTVGTMMFGMILGMLLNGPVGTWRMLLDGLLRGDA